MEFESSCELKLLWSRWGGFRLCKGKTSITMNTHICCAIAVKLWRLLGKQILYFFRVFVFPSKFHLTPEYPQYSFPYFAHWEGTIKRDSYINHASHCRSPNYNSIFFSSVLSKFRIKFPVLTPSYLQIQLSIQNVEKKLRKKLLGKSVLLFVVDPHYGLIE